MKNCKKLICFVSFVLVLTLILHAVITPKVSAVIFDNTENKDITAENPVMKPNLVTSGSAIDIQKENTYTISTIDESVVVPFSISNAAMAMTVNANADTGTIEIYKDADTTELFHTFSLQLDEKTISDTANYFDAVGFPVSKGTTYYLKIADENKDAIYQIGLRSFSSENRVILSNTNNYGYAPSPEEYIYYQIDVSDVTLLKIYGDLVNIYGATEEGTLKVCLCEKNKTTGAYEELSKQSTLARDKYIAYEVRKGTYYLRIKTSHPLFYIKYTMTANNSKYGLSKPEAIQMEFGDTYNGFLALQAAKDTYKYYKVTIVKDRPLYLTFTGDVTAGGELEIDIFGTTSNKTKHLLASGISVSENKMPIVIDGKTTLPKGTYYIGVSKSIKKSSGSYTLKVTR